MATTTTKQNLKLLITNGSVDPRIRMKEVRYLVRKKLKNNERIDLIPLNAEDKDRALVAIQDLLEHEKKRHAKARNHIIEQKEATLDVIALMSLAMENLINVSQEDFSKITVMSIERENMVNELNKLAELSENTLQEKYKLSVQLNAALTTIDTLLSHNNG